MSTDTSAPLPVLKDPWVAHAVVDAESRGGWVVAYVEANSPGYFATTYTGDRAYCEGVATSINESKGVDAETARQIVSSSIFHPGFHYDGPAIVTPNPFRVGDMAEHVLKDLDAREVAAVEGDTIRLRIGDTVTDPVPAFNYRPVGG